MPRAVVVQHVAHEGPGWLAEVLDDAGVAIDLRRMYDGAGLHGVEDADAIIVLGGPMAATDDARVSWLGPVKGVLARCIDTSTPTLGVCLGAQLLALAAGGRVEPGGRGPELGLAPVTLTDAAAGDPLFAGLPAAPQTVHWHWDHVAQLPPGATLLASSAAYPHQAFRVGPRAWGLQFHPEVTLPLVAQWAQDDAAAIRADGREPTEIVGAVAAVERELLMTWTPLLESFAAQVTTRS